jgi:hypothetical protein
MPSRFEQFNLSLEETAIASRFTDIQLAYLKNLRTEAINDRLALKVDPEHLQDFIQNEAYLKGKIEVLSTLIGD